MKREVSVRNRFLLKETSIHLNLLDLKMKKCKSATGGHAGPWKANQTSVMSGWMAIS
jgi:hypothetical protein